MAETVKIAIQGDAKGLVAAAKAGDKALDGLGDQAKVTGRNVDEMGRDVRDAEQKVDKLGASAEKVARKIDRLGRASHGMKSAGRVIGWGSEKIVNQYTALAGGIGAAMVGKSTAGLDQSLIRIKQTANATVPEMFQLRAELFRLSKISGKPIENLASGFDDLVQSGQSWKAATAEIGAVNMAMGVTGATASELAGGLRTASEAYHIDLSEPGKALELLDKMRVAGKAGSAELKDISDIFARIGPNAASAGMGLDQALAFVEVLSKTESNPERLATLSDSVLRLFNNLTYQKAASKGTGVSFYNKDKSKRDAAAVLQDLRTQYLKQKDDLSRDRFIQKAFGKSDLDTIKGLRVLLGGDSLGRLASYGAEIKKSSGTLAKELPEALGNAIDQSARLAAVFRNAADGFARPIVDLISKTAKWGSDHEGAAIGIGSGVGAGVLAAGGIVAGMKLVTLLAEFNAIRRGGKAGLGGSVAGALGAAGATPVFVVNMGAGGLGGLGTMNPVAAEAAAVNTASKAGLFARTMPTFARWIETSKGWIGRSAHGLGMWTKGAQYTAERVLGRYGAGRFMMRNAGSAMEFGSKTWRNATWGSNLLGRSVQGLSKLTPFLRGFGPAAAIGLPIEWMLNGFNLRSTVGGIGGALGGTGGALLGTIAGLGAASVPVGIAGGIAGGYAGNKAAYAAYDLIAAYFQNAPAAAAASAAEKQAAFSPIFNVGVNFDAMGRPTTQVTGNGSLAFKVNAPTLGPAWAT